MTGAILIHLKLWEIITHVIFSLLLIFHDQIMSFESLQACSEDFVCFSHLQVMQFQMYSHRIWFSTKYIKYDNFLQAIFDEVVDDYGSNFVVIEKSGDLLEEFFEILQSHANQYLFNYNMSLNY